MNEKNGKYDRFFCLPATVKIPDSSAFVDCKLPHIQTVTDFTTLRVLMLFLNIFILTLRCKKIKGKEKYFLSKNAAVKAL